MCKNAALSQALDGEWISVAGTLGHLQLKRTVDGKDWAVLTVVHDGEAATVIVFVGVFATLPKDLLCPEAPVRVSGRVYSSSDGMRRIVATTVESAIRPCRSSGV